MSGRPGLAVDARRRRPHGGDDGGFTAVELLVVMVIMGVVLSVATSAVITTLQNQRKQMERLEALNETKTALHRVTRDLRGANPVLDASSADAVQVVAELGGVERTVEFRLAGGELLMEVTTASGTNVHTLATSLDGTDPVFRYFDDTGTELAVPADPEEVAAVEVSLVRVLPEEGDLTFADRITVRNAGG